MNDRKTIIEFLGFLQERSSGLQSASLSPLFHSLFEELTGETKQTSSVLCGFYYYYQKMDLKIFKEPTKKDFIREIEIDLCLQSGDLWELDYVRKPVLLKLKEAIKNEKNKKE